MDVLLATIAGVGVRSVLYSLHELFGNTTPILIGAWEGLAIHQLSRMRRHSTADHYLAYAFRSIADIILFGNIRRIVFIALWTGVSVISAEAIYPAPRSRSRSSRHKSTRSTRTRTHEVMERPQRVPVRNSSPPRINRNDVVPTVRPSQPPTPPSFFLEGESDVAPNSPSPYIPPPSHEEEEEEEEESPLPKHILLPTPSLHAPTESLDQDLERHLYTIEEASTELSRDEFAALGAPAPYAPSIATTMPIPVPNPTTYFHRNASQINLADFQDENLDDSYAESGPPIVVPNATSEYTHDAQPERPFSPAESDGLTTPGKAPYPLGGANDPLQTPPAMSPAFSDRQQLPNDPLLTPPQLSPVFSDKQLAGFSSPSQTHVIIPPPSSKPPPSMIQVLNSATASVTTTVTGPDSGNEKTAKNGPVEYLSSSAKKAPSKPPPDSETVSEAGSDETDSDETVISALSNGNSNQIYARAEALRDEAKKMENKRVELVKELDEAKNKGDTKKILFLKEEIRVAEVESKKLHERAVRRFIKARNSERKPQTVDVHGLKVNEAISTTERALRQAYTMGYPSINVIVGKGLHSAGGKPVLKQAIQRHMETQLNIPCQVHPTNAGVLVCQIPNSQ